MSAQHPLLWTSSAGSPGMQGNALERPVGYCVRDRDAVTVIATAAGERTLTFPHAMRPAEGGARR